MLLAADGSFGQRKGAFGLARQYEVYVDERFTGDRLAAWIGVDRVTALAVTDAGLAAGIQALLQVPTPGPEKG